MGEPHAKAPVLPLDFPTIDLKAHALRLYNVERFDIRTKSIDIFGRVIAHLLGNRDDVMVLDPDHFHLVQVDHDDETVDGMGIVVVAVFKPRPEQGAR